MLICDPGDLVISISIWPSIHSAAAGGHANPTGHAYGAAAAACGAAAAAAARAAGWRWNGRCDDAARAHECTNPGLRARQCTHVARSAAAFALTGSAHTVASVPLRTAAALFAADGPVARLSGADVTSGRVAADVTQLWVVEFHLPSCAPCEAFAPEFSLAVRRRCGGMRMPTASFRQPSH
jgi:hypothetical protein